MIGRHECTYHYTQKVETAELTENIAEIFVRDLILLVCKL